MEIFDYMHAFLVFLQFLQGVTLKFTMWTFHHGEGFIVGNRIVFFQQLGSLRFEITDIATKPVMDFVHVRRPSSFVRAFEITVETFLHFKIVIV